MDELTLTENRFFYFFTIVQLRDTHGFLLWIDRNIGRVAQAFCDLVLFNYTILCQVTSIIS